jgi:hypothetical protein
LPGTATSTGATGWTGETGPTGEIGPQGEPGPQGLPGTATSTGATGETGPTGPTIYTVTQYVATGPTGDYTATGPTGDYTAGQVQLASSILTTGVTGNIWSLATCMGINNTLDPVNFTTLFYANDIFMPSTTVTVSPYAPSYFTVHSRTYDPVGPGVYYIRIFGSNDVPTNDVFISTINMITMGNLQ